jgi:DNA-binding LacI/PurR family transcriptional regulator
MTEKKRNIVKDGVKAGKEKNPEEPPRGRYTIRDIARLANVSRSTVSLAINDSPKINKETKARVLEVIEQVGFRPNQAARNLVSRESGTILVVAPQIDHVFSDWYFSEGLSGILDAATRLGRHLMVELATESFKNSQRALKLWREQVVDGVLIIGALTTDSYVQEIASSGCPVVLVNSLSAGIPSVTAANQAGAIRAVQHLMSLGHKRIAHIKGSEQVTYASERLSGYLKAMEEHGAPLDPSWIVQGWFGQKSGAEAMTRLMALQPRPTAVFVANDLMAIGAMEAAESMGLSVPEDVAVVGMDDIQLAHYVHPGLTTVRQSMYTVGEAAVEHLMAKVEGRPVYTPVIQVGMRLVIRESCGARLAERRRQKSQSKKSS